MSGLLAVDVRLAVLIGWGNSSAVRYFSSSERSNRPSRSGRIGAIGSCSTLIAESLPPSASSEQISSRRRHSALIVG